MSAPNPKLKQRVRDFWQANPCGIKFADAELGSRRFFELVEKHRYETEWHIPAAADFGSTAGLRVLEIGCGLGTDAVQFARAGADYTGVDLTDAAVELARKRFEMFALRGTFRTADAENLAFDDGSFDMVYSHGVLHHTPDTAGAIREVHRVLKKGGRAVIMLYHRNSYNYRINIRVLRRAGMHLLRWKAGQRLINLLTAEPIESLRDHAAKLRESNNGRVGEQDFLSQNTDGAGNPLARVYSIKEARDLFKDFSEVRFRAFFLNKRFIPIVGNLLPRSIESRLAARWGWHLWIYATK